MTLIPEQFIVWIGSTIHGMDDTYGPFDSIEAAEEWLDSQPGPPRSVNDYLILKLNQPRANVCG